MEKISIGRKLQKSRVDLLKKNLKKSGLNKHSGFKYYELSDFLPAVTEIFYENGLYSVFNMEGEASVDVIKKFDQKNNQIADAQSLGLKGIATLTIHDADDDGKQIKFTMPVVGANAGGSAPIQSLGGVRTYLERYLYMNALEIVESDWIDAPPKEEEKVAGAQKDEMDDVKTLEELNDTFLRLKSVHTKDVSWKTRLMKKANSLGAVFNKEINAFEFTGGDGLPPPLAESASKSEVIAAII